jgi:hypothetical protein
MSISLWRKALIGGAVVVAGVAGAFVAVATTGDATVVARDTGAQSAPEPTAAVVSDEDIVYEPPFPVNSSGQTYGSSLKTGVLDGPDLMSAITKDGTQGFVLKTDVVTPEEANGVSTTEAREIPVYDVEGKTVLGTITIDPADGIAGSEIPSPSTDPTSRP